MFARPLDDSAPVEVPMDRYSLEDLADDSLLDGLHRLVSDDRNATADLLAHIAEVQRRRLFGALGFPSMRAYCVEVLHLSDDAARKRIQVARKGWLFPVIFEAIADGRVHLSGMAQLAPFLDDENVNELIEGATHRTRAEIELMLAERFPLPEPDDDVEPLRRDAPGHLRSRSEVKPLAPNRHLVQYTANDDDKERLQYALQLMSHRNPKGSLAILHRAAMALLITELEKEKFGATDQPRESDRSVSGRTIPHAVQRAVWERDGGQCTFVSETGRRCACRWMVEFDHIHEFARGGEATVDNLRLLCRLHNQLEADRAYGRAFMERKREAARAEHAPGGVEDEPSPTRFLERQASEGHAAREKSPSTPA